MNARHFIVAAVAASFTFVLTGCGSSEESKPPSGSNYYQGEMKPKAGGNSAVSGKATGATATDK